MVFEQKILKGESIFLNHMGDNKLEFKVNETSDAIIMKKDGKEYVFPAVVCAPGSREKLKGVYKELGMKYIQ